MGNVLSLVPIVCLFAKHVSSAIVCQEDHLGHGLSLGLDSITIQAFGFSLLVLYFVYSIFSPNSNDGTDHEVTVKFLDPHPRQKALGVQSSCKNDMLSEYPVQQSAGHIVFEKTGVEVKAADSFTVTEKCLPRDLILQACTEAVFPDVLGEDELPLSPAIKFILSTAKLDRPLEVWIPHGANMVLTGQNWSVILKEYQNHSWVTVGQTNTDFIAKEVKSFVCKSNHVRFKTDHLSTFKLTGKFDKSSISVFKRMKVVAFCNDTRVGEDIVVRLYCFDDCEWSFERLMRMEQKIGGKLISSIESVNFSVTSKQDVDIAIKDLAGWQLEKASPMKFSYESLKNSFNVIPQCDLVFHPCSKTLSYSFFVAMVFTHESSGETMMYASTALKKILGDPGKGMASDQVEEQEGSTECVVNL